MIVITANPILGQEYDYEDLFGPSVKYLNGNYWGEFYFDATLGYKIPHGRGKIAATISRIFFKY